MFSCLVIKREAIIQCDPQEAIGRRKMFPLILHDYHRITSFQQIHHMLGWQNVDQLIIYMPIG